MIHKAYCARCAPAVERSARCGRGRGSGDGPEQPELADQPAGEGLDREVPIEQPTLVVLDSHVAQHLPVGLGLDAFGHHDQTQAAGQPGDRLDHGARGGVTVDEESTVELDAIDRQRGEVAEVRVSDPEVVDPNRHPAGPEALQRRATPLEVDVA